MKLLDLLKLFGEYGDELLAVAAIFTELKAAKDAREVAIIIVKAAKILASKTKTEIDEDVVELVQHALTCPEFQAAWNELVKDVRAELLNK